MRTSLTIPEDLEIEIQRRSEMLGEKPSTILRLALRAGLPTVGQNVALPDGYFAEAYKSRPKEWADLENATAKWPQPEPK
jgi:hypothetical protein